MTNQKKHIFCVENDKDSGKGSLRDANKQS